MIKSVTVTNYLGESIKLELGFPEKSGFLIQSITGLGPSKADINVSEIATNDGSIYNSARVNARNIVLNFKLMANNTVEDMRLLSYKYFPIKKQIKLEIETDNRICYIYGYVESNEPNIFSKMETTQISIICPDPYFYSIDNNTIIFSGIESIFEFPFENDSLLENDIEFSEVKDNRSQVINYTGDSEVGMVITIHALNNATNIIIYNIDTRESMKIDTTKLEELTGSGILVGDDIIISTVRGSKYIHLFRGGEYINILNCLDKNADWFQLSTGENTFAYYADTGVNNLEFKIQYNVVYEGV